MEVRKKFLKEVPKFNEPWENKYLTRWEKVKLNYPLHKKKIAFYFAMVGFSYCFPVYQYLAIAFEKKDIWLKKAGWLALGLTYKEPTSILETKSNDSSNQLIQDKDLNTLIDQFFLSIDQKLIYGFTLSMFKSFDTISLSNKNPYDSLSLTEVKLLLKDKPYEEIINFFQDLEANISTFKKLQQEQKIMHNQSGEFWRMLDDSEHLPIRRKI
jgi:hypothetical protein